MILSKYVRDPNMMEEVDNLSQYFQVEQSVLTNCEIFLCAAHTLCEETYICLL